MKLKCIICGEPLENTDFYCSFACAIEGIRGDANKLMEAAQDLGHMDIQDMQDEAYSTQCDREKESDRMADISLTLN